MVPYHLNFPSKFNFYILSLTQFNMYGIIKVALKPFYPHKIKQTQKPNCNQKAYHPIGFLLFLLCVSFKKNLKLLGNCYTIN